MASTPPRVAIVLATYQPHHEMLHRQLRSLVRQTHNDFTCLVHDDGTPNGVEHTVHAIVGDDPRFIVVEHADNVGFYRNFERGLEHARLTGAEFIALADQDDIWYPTKLAATLEHLRSNRASLAFTDVVPVNRNRAVLGGTFFAHRYPTTSSVLDLTLMNSVIGATAVMTADLLALALPFPPARARSFHDHWIARCAQFADGLAHLPMVSMEYVQHGGNVQGFTEARHRLRDFVAAARQPNTESFAADRQLVSDRLAELHDLATRVERMGRVAHGDARLSHLRRAVDLHEACLAGSRRALLRLVAMWWRDQHLHRRPRHEHVEIRYARAVARSRAAGRVLRDVA